MAGGDALTGGGPDEHFCLKWNDYQDSILHTLQDLKDDEDFVDVTLVCNGTPLTAHQLMLSACSDFFRHVLKNLSDGRRPAHAHPVIVLWDVSADDMRKILRFMYNGEVEVPQAHLNPFLSVAEKLRVRGLCQSGGQATPEPPPTHPMHPASRASPTPGPSAHPSRFQTPSPSADRRRPSLESQAVKRPKLEPLAPDADRPGGPLTVKSEDGGLAHSPEPDPHHGPRDSLELEDVSSRSTHGTEGNNGDYDSEDAPDPTRLPPHLLGMAGLAGMSQPGLLDPNAAKEFWCRAAAMASMNFPGSSGLSTPSRSSPTTPKPMMDGFESTRRQRSVFSSQQIGQLESYFQVNEYIDGDRKRHLSQITNIPEQQIKVWFQNRRQKKKREMEEFSQPRDQHQSRSSQDS